MNGFTDVHVAFGSTPRPVRTRLGNAWKSLGESIDGIWIGSAKTDAGPPLVEVQAPGWRVWAMGDLYTYRGEALTALQRFASDLAFHTAAPAELDVHGIVFAWEEGPRRLHLWTNRLGTVHAYRSGNAGSVSLGTFMPAVAEVSSRALDWIGITGFLGFGFYPGARTMFDDVDIIRPATWTVFDDRGAVLSQRRYWEWTHEPDDARSDDDLVDEFHDVWTRTLQVQLGEQKVVIPVSGGLDSRTLLAGAAPTGEQSPNVRAFTYGYSTSSVEIRLARRVAAVRGLTAAEWVVTPYLLGRLDEVSGALEGFSSLSMARQAGASDLIAGLGDRVAGGHWGDVWFDTAGAFGHELEGTEAGLVDLAFAKIAKRGREQVLQAVCGPHLDSEPDDVLRGILADELARLPDVGDADMQLKALKTEQWSFRWTVASMRAYQLALPTVLPFYANEIVDFFLKVPTERLPGRRLQTAYLRRHHPDMAAVAWQETGMSLFEHRWEPPVALAHRAAAKGIRTARRRPIVERNWEVQYGGERSRKLRTELIDTRMAGWDELQIRPVVDDFLASPSPSTAYGVDGLLTLVEALKQTEA